MAVAIERRVSPRMDLVRCAASGPGHRSHIARVDSELALVGFAAAMLATIGIVLHARWSAAFSMIAAVALVGTAVQLARAPVPFAFPAGALWTGFVLLAASGAVATTVSALVQLRTARSWIGTRGALTAATAHTEHLAHAR